MDDLNKHFEGLDSLSDQERKQVFDTVEMASFLANYYVRNTLDPVLFPHMLPGTEIAMDIHLRIVFDSPPLPALHD